MKLTEKPDWMHPEQWEANQSDEPFAEIHWMIDRMEAGLDIHQSPELDALAEQVIHAKKMREIEDKINPPSAEELKRREEEAIEGMINFCLDTRLGGP